MSSAPLAPLSGLRPLLRFVAVLSGLLFALSPTPAAAHDALCPEDNSYRVTETTRRRCSAPASVAAVASRLEHEDRTRLEQFEPDPHIDSTLVRTLGPGALQVFILKQRGPTGNSVDYFIVYDPVADRCAEATPYVCGKWTELFASDPNLALSSLLRFSSLEGKAVFVVSEVVHNGSVYTGLVEHYYELAPGPTVRQILALETKAYDFRDARQLIHRALVPAAAGFQLETSVEDLRTHVTRPVGRVAIARLPPTGPYRLVRRASAPVPPSDYPLVSCWTSAPAEDDLFLRDGYTVYY